MIATAAGTGGMSVAGLNYAYTVGRRHPWSGQPPPLSVSGRQLERLLTGALSARTLACAVSGGYQNHICRRALATSRSVPRR